MLVLNFLCVENILFFHYAIRLKVFQTFHFSLFQVKMVDHSEVYAIPVDIEHQIYEDILYHYLHYSFFIQSSLNWDISSTHLNRKKIFSEILPIHANYLCPNTWHDDNIWWLFLFFIIFHMFVISFLNK